MKKSITKQRITRVTMTLLVMMLTSMTAWADGIATLMQDGDEWYVNMPVTGTNTLEITANDITAGKGTFKVYDDGGKNGRYSNGCDGTLVLKAPEGFILQLSGSVTTDGINDKLTVYNGSNDNGMTQLGDPLSGTQSGINKISTGKFMTLNFTTNTVFDGVGFDLTVTLVVAPNEEYDVTINTAEGGSVTANPTSAKIDETITLTANPASGYVLSGISVTDASSNPIAVRGGKWYDNTATFTMPGSVATVTPTFTDNLTNLSVNMPTTDEEDKIVTIPAGVESFKVYDDGGKDNNHSQNCTGALVLTAPENYLLRLSGKITTDAYDYLTVYDGSKENGSKLLNEVRSTSSGTETGIKPVTSKGNVMTIYFYTNNFYEEAGLDLTVTVVNPNANYNVTVNPAENGSISASVGSVNNATTAKVNETVTLTASPASDYLLSGISVTDDGSNSVAVTWDGSFSNTATFTMPGCDVTVTPTFTNNLTAAGGLYINMPATDSKELTIPSGVQSFKVYDDGGKDGNYSNYYDGTLVMTAPTGYVLQLSGGITAESSDKLTVYNGSTTNSTKLIDAMGGIGSTKKDISIVTSSGNIMMLFFHSDYSMNYAGLDLTVTLMPTYTITYNLNEGTNATGNPATYTANTETFTLVDPSRDGYEFAGWFSDSEFNTPATTTITKGSTGDKTFWAKWKKLMTNADITVTIPEEAWTGSELTPDITVKDGETPLTLNTDYTVNAPSGTIQDTGDYTYNITGVGNYAGSKEATFTIIAKETTLGAATIVQDQNGNTAIFDGTSTETINITEDVTVNSVIYNRTFTPDKPATVMLPFSLGEGQTLTGGTLYKFSGVTKNNETGMWEATMTEATTLQANTPCLLMPNNGLTYGKVTFNLNSTTVTLNTNGGGNCQTADHGSHWMFKGTYSYKEWISGGANDEEIGKVYGFAGVAKPGIEVGDFVKVASGAKIRPMGCYLLWNDEPNPSRAAARSAATEELPQSITVRLISANGEVTGIGEIDTKTGEMTFESEAWYTLNGVRLSGKPTKKGLYINNGRKVVVK